MLLIAVFLPLFNFLLCILFGGYIKGKYLAQYMVAMMGLVFVGLVLIFPLFATGVVQTVSPGV